MLYRTDLRFKKLHVLTLYVIFVKTLLIKEHVIIMRGFANEYDSISFNKKIKL
jgi:hypothetical protein